MSEREDLEVQRQLGREHIVSGTPYGCRCQAGICLLHRGQATCDFRKPDIRNCGICGKPYNHANGGFCICVIE